MIDVLLEMTPRNRLRPGDAVQIRERQPQVVEAGLLRRDLLHIKLLVHHAFF